MKVVIIGGVATGPKAAARLRRVNPQAEITIIEQGDLISYGACGLPLYLGSLVPNIDELRTTSSGLLRDAEFFQKQRDIKVLTNTQAIAIDRSQKMVRIKELSTNKEKSLKYDYLVLATGAKPFIPPIEGINLDKVYTLHHPQDAEHIRAVVKAKKIGHVTIIGAGLIGLETADALASPRLKVTICESQKQVLPKLLDPDMAKLVERQIKSRGINIRFECTVKEFQGNDEGRVCRVITDKGEIETEMVIVAAGVRPEVGLAKNSGLTIGFTGAIQVNPYLQTDDPFIYAGGDCVEQRNTLTGNPVYIPLASTGNKQGRVIADNIAGKKEAFPGIAQTSVLQAFDLNIGRTGLGEEEAQKLGYKTVSVITSGLDSTHFYPMHSSITMKLIADETSGRLLGAQVSGQGEGIKRLDVLAASLKFNASLDDLSNLDLGYAPPFSTAIDVVIHAANALENKRLGLIKGIGTSAVLQLLSQGKKIVFVDVREDEEREAKPLNVENVWEIPLGQLRERYQEIPSDSLVVTVCELGIRGYEAACFIQGAGFTQAVYLEGGMSTWTAFQD